MRMMRTFAATILLAAVLGGCGEVTVNSGSGSGSGNGDGTAACTPYHADPWTAFTPALSGDVTMKVGDRAHLGFSLEAKDVRVKGDSGVISVSDESMVISRSCPSGSSSVSWVQVDALAPGKVTIEYTQGAVAKAHVITVQ